MEHSPIPKEELDVFKRLPNVRVVFDVGARADVDYLSIKPKAIYHLFEPNPDFFAELKEKVEELPHVYLNNVHPHVFLNNYGLGDEEGTFAYSDGIQAFTGGEAPMGYADRALLVKTLDGYIEEKGITRIDFLKIDAEGYDFKVLLGGPKAIEMTRFIQYEHWDNKGQYHDLLGSRFDMHYIGYRNVLCINQALVPQATRTHLRLLIEYYKYALLA